MAEEKRQKQPDYRPEDMGTTKRSRGWWIKTLFLIVLIVLSIVMLFTLGDYLSGEEEKQLGFGEMLKQINYPMFGVLLGVILLYILVESGKYSFLLKKYTGKFRFRTAVKTMFIGKYYDGITPFNTGGQPFQIYYLHKKSDIPHGPASAIPVLRYIVNISVLTIVAIVLLSLSPLFLKATPVTKTILILSWVSLVVNVSLPVMVILFSLFPRPCKKLVIGLIHFLKKLHLVKNPYRATIKYVRELSEYSTTLKQFLREIYKYIPLILLSMMECLLFLTIPFFVVTSIGNVEPSMELMMQIACLIVITRYSALLMPTPGNTGAVEATGSLVFITVSGIGSVIGWVVLTWRFFTYYFYLLAGIVINIFEIIRSSYREKRKNK